MTTRETLLAEVQQCESALQTAHQALIEHDSLPENNNFDSLSAALCTIKNKLRNRAEEACEGSYVCGLDSYEQEFLVFGKRYLATLEVSYNRHDKTYYYIEETAFSHKEI